jgi:hypothetical protein
LALGAVRPVIDDFYLPEEGARASEFIVDIKLVPTGDSDEFDDPLTFRLGAAIQLPPSGQQFATIRTRGVIGLDGSDARVQHRFLGGWECDRDAALHLPELDAVLPDQRRLISFFLLEASRDIVGELRQLGVSSLR